MWRCSPDLTIDEILRDPLIRAQMNADRVAAADLEALLRSLALRSAERASRPPLERGPGRLTAPSHGGNC